MDFQNNEYLIYRYIFSRILRSHYNESTISEDEIIKLNEYKLKYSEIYSTASSDALEYIDNQVSELHKIEEICKHEKNFTNSIDNSSKINSIELLQEITTSPKDNQKIIYLSKLFKIENKDLHLSYVKGDSMINIGISDGDLVAYKAIENLPRNNSIIIIEVNSSIFVKRIRFDENNIFLISENKNYPAFKINDDTKIKIIGEVIGVIKKIN